MNYKKKYFMYFFLIIIFLYICRSFLGFNDYKEPAYKILSNANGYQIRSYQKYFIAEVPNKNGFRILAKYIGVFG